MELATCIVISLVASLIVFVVCAMGCYASYRNGVKDGYGYSREPNCPGYAKAGEYLRKYMANRWPELRQCQHDWTEVSAGGRKSRFCQRCGHIAY